MKCAAGTIHPIGRMMFESFAKECCANHDRLERLYASYYRTDYEEYKKRPQAYLECFEQGRLAGSMDDKEAVLKALAQAIKAETESSDHYNRLASTTADKTLGIQVIRSDSQYVTEVSKQDDYEHKGNKRDIE